jgi:hypothetical protein
LVVEGVWGVVSGSIAGEASVMIGVVRTSSSEFGVLGEARRGVYLYSGIAAFEREIFLGEGWLSREMRR